MSFSSSLWFSGIRADSHVGWGGIAWGFGSVQVVFKKTGHTNRFSSERAKCLRAPPPSQFVHFAHSSNKKCALYTVLYCSSFFATSSRQNYHSGTSSVSLNSSKTSTNQIVFGRGTPTRSIFTSIRQNIWIHSLCRFPNLGTHTFRGDAFQLSNLKQISLPPLSMFDILILAIQIDFF